MVMQSLVLVVLLVMLCSVSLAAVGPTEKPTMAVRVESGDYLVRGQTIRVPVEAKLSIDLPERLHVDGEEHVISDERPNLYQVGTMLTKTLGPVDSYIRYPDAIDPDSVRVYSSEAPSTVYEEGKDYFLEHDWGGLSRLETGKIAKDARIRVDYDITYQRLDLIQVTADGVVSLKKGSSVMANAEAPSPDTGCIKRPAVPFRPARESGGVVRSPLAGVRARTRRTHATGARHLRSSPQPVPEPPAISSGKRTCRSAGAVLSY